MDEESATYNGPPARVLAVPAGGVILWVAGVYLHAADPPAIQHMKLTGQFLDNGRFILYFATFLLTLVLWLCHRPLLATVAAVAGTWLSCATVLGPVSGRWFGWLTIPYVFGLFWCSVHTYDGWQDSPAGRAARQRRELARAERERAATETRLAAAIPADWTAPQEVSTDIGTNPAAWTAPVQVDDRQTGPAAEPEPVPAVTRVASPVPVAERPAPAAPAPAAPRPAPPDPEREAREAERREIAQVAEVAGIEKISEVRVIWRLLHSGGTTGGEVAACSAMSPATAKRRLAALRDHGFARVDGEGGARRFYPTRDGL